MLTCASEWFLGLVVLLGLAPFASLLIFGPDRVVRWLNERHK